MRPHCAGGRHRPLVAGKKETPLSDAPNDAVAQILNVEHELNSYIFGRREEIRGLLLALISRNHVFLLSPPGAGKSMLAAELCRRLRGGVFFKKLLTQHTQPEELFGPFNIIKLRDEGDLVRETAGYLPEAHVALVDEIWKCNAAIINTLLSVTNEREHFNGRRVEKVPLISLVVTSNETPAADASLEAIYDRILLRYQANPVRDHEARSQISRNDRIRRGFELAVRSSAARVLTQGPEHLRQLRDEGEIDEARKLERSLADLAADPRPEQTILDRYGVLFSELENLRELLAGHELDDDITNEALEMVQRQPAYTDVVLDAMVFCDAHGVALPYRYYLSLEQLNELQAETLDVSWPDVVERAFFDLLDRLENKTSVRREVELRKLVAAQAVLARRREVMLSDLGVLAHALWDTVDEIRSVRAIVDEISGQLEAEVVRLIDAIREEAATGPYSSTPDVAADLARARQIRRYRDELERLAEAEKDNELVRDALTEARSIENSFNARAFSGPATDDGDVDEEDDDDSKYEYAD